MHSSDSAHPAVAEAPNQLSINNGDKTLPLNWGESRKRLVVVIISGMSFIVNLSTVICAPASIQIMHDLHFDSNFLAVFYITAWNLGEAIAPLYVGPLSERVGRLPVYHVCNILFLVFTAITGWSRNIGMIIAFRFLTGAVTTSICLNPSIVGDMYPIQSRGAAMSIMSLMPLVGTAVGPIAGGYVTQHLSWRWTFWLTAILTAIVEAAMLIVYRETYLPCILRKRDRKRAAAAGVSTNAAKRNLALYQLLLTITRFIFRPFAVLLRSRGATVMALYLSVIYAYLFLLATTLATEFQKVYGFSETNSGLIYLGLAIGMFIGTLFCRYTLDRIMRRTAQRELNAESTPPIVAEPVRLENRLLPAVPGMVILPAALLTYGWTLQKRSHWSVPAVAVALAGFCLSTTTIPIMNFLVDIFGDVSASAIAAVLPLRYMIGTFLPAAAPYMYDRLGYGWANSLLAFLMILCLPAPLLIIIPFKKNSVWASYARVASGS
ncbi:major facilitator superfamily domain-containing protein [Phaeosphaeriaceae sp. PMI808]|nr:major facilitator superfamily domain-containing protein [Phaeosphaeriaceae sp. PMI808]